MLKAEVLKRYQKFWIKRSLRTKHKVETYEEYSALRLLCENLLNDADKQLMEQIMMDDIMERTVDTMEEATFNRLALALQNKENPFIVNSYLHDGSTPLHVLAKAGFSDCVRVLIQNGANVNAIHTQLGHSVLHVATMSGSYKCMNHLVNAGASRTYINTMAGRRRSALHYAAERGCAPCLLMLLNPNQGNVMQRNEEQKQVRAIVDLTDSFGNTALHLACVDGSEECVKILIEAGASATVRNIEGKTPVDVAKAMNGPGAVGAVLFLVLIAAGLDPMTEVVDDSAAGASNTQESATESAATEESFHTGRTAVSLLDDIVSEGNNTTAMSDASHANGATGEALWVLVQDGMLVCSCPPWVDSTASQHRKTDPSKISKRLRFVRRSIIGNYGNDADSMDTPPNEVEDSATVGATVSKVEVFSWRAEAEQRARSFIHADIQSHKSKVTVNGFTSVHSPMAAGQFSSPATQQGPLSPSGAGAWGSHRRSIGATNSVNSSAVVTPNNSGAASSASGGNSSAVGLTCAAYQSNSVYQVACIHSERLSAFKANVPHYYPLHEASRVQNSHLHAHARAEPGHQAAHLHHRIHSPHKNNHHHQNKHVNEETEDPMWASFKRTHSDRSLKTNSYYGRDAYQSDINNESKVFDTSRSNKPVKLHVASPTPRLAITSSSPHATTGTSDHTKQPSSSQKDATAATDCSAGASSTSASAVGDGAAVPVKASPQTTASAVMPAVVTQRSRKQLAEDAMELTTSIATVNAQIFELMCLLEELQASQPVESTLTKGSAEQSGENGTEPTTPTPAVEEDLLQLHSEFPAPKSNAGEAAPEPLTLSTDSVEGAGSPGTSPQAGQNSESEAVWEVNAGDDLYADMDMHAHTPEPSPVAATPATTAPAVSPVPTPPATSSEGSIPTASGADELTAAATPSSIASPSDDRFPIHSVVPTSKAVLETPMLDFKSPALRSPINIHVDAAHQHDHNAARHLNMNMNLELEMEMEGIVLSMHDDLRMNLDMLHEGEDGSDGLAHQQHVLQMERLGDLSEESLSYLNQGVNEDATPADSDALRWEEL